MDKQIVLTPGEPCPEEIAELEGRSGRGALGIPGVLTETSLELPRTISEEDATECGAVLLRIRESSGWWLGDWMNSIQELFPETWPQMAESSEFAESTCRKWGWICRSVPRGTREKSLSPRHHELVAHLEPEEQRKYLDLAKPTQESEPPKMSTRELGQRIKSDQEGPKNVEMVDVICCAKCGEVYPMREARTWKEAAE